MVISDCLLCSYSTLGCSIMIGKHQHRPRLSNTNACSYFTGRPKHGSVPISTSCRVHQQHSYCTDHVMSSSLRLVYWQATQRSVGASTFFISPARYANRSTKISFGLTSMVRCLRFGKNENKLITRQGAGPDGWPRLVFVMSRVRPCFNV